MFTESCNTQTLHVLWIPFSFARVLLAIRYPQTSQIIAVNEWDIDRDSVTVR